jgi:anaerobic selenocysteine-containing dehydrogenase
MQTMQRDATSAYPRAVNERAFRTCHLCEAMCGLTLTREGGRVTAIEGDADDVFSHGHICPKGPALRELHEDPDRLRGPMRRTARGFEPVSWDEALDEAASRLSAIQKAHGRSAVGVYLGNPAAHAHGTILGAQALSLALRTRNKFDANSQDANPRLYASLLLYGELTTLPIPDIDRTRFFLILGANPAASNGSIMTLGDVRGRLRGVRERGGRVVLIDPRRTETAAYADEHLFIRPGGDAALLAAMLHVIFAEGLYDERAISALADGLDGLRRAVLVFDPERVAARVGMDAAVIRRLARELATTRPAVVYGRVGVCLNEHATTATWLVDALNIVTGNFDVPGGAMFPTPAADLSTVARRLGIHHHDRYRSRVRGLPELGGMLPAAAIAEEMETPGPGQIRGFVTIAGNPVLSVPNGPRIASALEGLDTYVAIDIYLNETTRHAHLVLPPCSPLERPQFDLIFSALAVRNFARWSEAVLPRAEGAKEDWDILVGLATRLVARRRGGLAGRVLEAAARRGAPSHERIVDLLLRLGPHPLTLAKLRAAPHGIDLGPLVPSAHERVRTPNRKVVLAPPVLLDDLRRVEAWLARSNEPLVMIGRRHVRSNNSWMHNLKSLVKGPERTSLLMHPDDAAARGLGEGAPVFVKSRVGEVSAKVELTTDIAPGVVSLPHGFGHASARETLRVAGEVAGPNLNALTDDTLLEPLTGTAILNGVPVEVRAAPAPRAE